MILNSDTRFGQHHRVVQLGHDHAASAPSKVRLSGLSNAMRSPQHSNENGPSSIACAQFSNTAASKSGTITGIVIAICTGAILARCTTRR
jgi:hypothetical protein